jgi:integrase
MFDSTESLTLGYGLTVEFDAGGRPKIAVTDAKPGDEAAIAGALERLQGLAKPLGEPVGRSPTPTIAEAMATILASPDLKPTSKMQYRRAFAFFSEFFGPGTRLSEIQAEEFSAFADHVRSRPDWAPKTHSFYITAGQRLFSYFWSRSSAVPRICAADLKPKRKGPDRHAREAYTLEQLEALFTRAARYRDSEPGKWWVTVATAFMGTRIEELTQAHLDGDFAFDAASGIHYLNVDETVRGRAPYKKSIKTKSGWRKVPIHPALVEAGFIKYLEAERLAGRWLPFEACWKPQVRKDGSMKVSQYVAKWAGAEMGRMRKEGLVGPKVTYFHSMRHTFTTLLSKADIGEEWRAALCGQQYGGVNASIYNKAKEDVSVTLPKLMAGLTELEAMFKRVCNGETCGEW